MNQKIIPLIGIFLLLASFSCGYQIKFYHPDLNKEDITMFVSNLNQSNLLEGIKVIKVYKCLNTYWDGRYLAGPGIIEIDACHYYEGQLYHELKHHFCYRTEKYWGHEGCFTKTIGLGEY